MQYVNALDNTKAHEYHLLMSDLRNNLIREIKAKGISQTKLAKLSGVEQPTINRFINGKINELKAGLVRKLADALGTTEAALRGFQENKKDRLKNIIELIEQLDDDQINGLELFIHSMIKIRQSDSRTVGQSDSRTVGQSDSRTVGQSDSRTVGKKERRKPVAPRRGECQTSKDIFKQRLMEATTTFQEMMDKHRSD